MPWREIRPMDEKVLFIADHLRGVYSHTALPDFTAFHPGYTLECKIGKARPGRPLPLERSTPH